VIELLGIPMAATSAIDIYSGVARMSGKVWASLHRAARAWRTAGVVVDPSAK
jgi:hypothetical protein